MKRWAFLTVALYLLCVSLLCAPILYVFVDASERASTMAIFFVYLVPVLVLAQAVLLLVPVARVQNRPVRRRRLLTAAIVGSVPMGIMAFALLGSLSLLIWGEDDMPDSVAWTVLCLPPVFWVIWAVVFYRSGVGSEGQSFTSTVTKWLLRSSILELLVAVPSHIVSRHRQECCAPFLTLLGIAAGLSVALLSFGPGVFFLFVNRIRGKRPQHHNPTDGLGAAGDSEGREE